MDIHDSVPSKVSTCENAMGLKKKKLKFLEKYPTDRTIRKFVQSDTFVAYKTRLKPLELCFCMLHPEHPEHPLPSRISARSSSEQTEPSPLGLFCQSWSEATGGDVA